MTPDDVIGTFADATPIVAPWGELRWLVNASVMPGACQTVGVVRIDPGQANPLHAHPNCEEVLYVLTGSCLHDLDEEEFALGPGAVIRIAAGVAHRARCTSDEPLVAVIFFSSPERETVEL
jgi:quercetin dioxygenase-like cupin family protein